MNGRIIGYVRIYDEREQGAIQTQFRAPLPPSNLFLLNFARIIWFFWDLRLTLFDTPKDVGSFGRKSGF